jgi:hypothetical protein
MDDSSEASLLVMNVSPFFTVIVMGAFVVKVEDAKPWDARRVEKA